MAEHIFPVCSPALLRGDPPLREPAGLRSQTLIHVSQTPDAWRGWLTHAGLPDLEPARAITYDHLSIALSAAEAGRGVALAGQFLCEQRLASGRLCVPFDLRASSPTTYHFVCREEDLGDRRITALRDWLVERLAPAASRASAVAK